MNVKERRSADFKDQNEAIDLNDFFLPEEKDIEKKWPHMTLSTRCDMLQRVQAKACEELSLINNDTDTHPSWFKDLRKTIQKVIETSASNPTNQQTLVIRLSGRKRDTNTSDILINDVAHTSHLQALVRLLFFEVVAKYGRLNVQYHTTLRQTVASKAKDIYGGPLTAPLKVRFVDALHNSRASNDFFKSARPDEACLNVVFTRTFPSLRYQWPQYIQCLEVKNSCRKGQSFVTLTCRDKKYIYDQKVEKEALSTHTVQKKKKGKPAVKPTEQTRESVFGDFLPFHGKNLARPALKDEADSDFSPLPKKCRLA